jgi:hypothetical protein
MTLRSKSGKSELVVPSSNSLIGKSLQLFDLEVNDSGNSFLLFLSLAVINMQTYF